MLVEALVFGGMFALSKRRKHRTKRNTVVATDSSCNVVRKTSAVPAKNHHQSPIQEATFHLTVSTAALGVSTLAFVMPALQPIGVGLLLYLCWPALQSTFKRWSQHRTLGHDFLVSLLMVSGLVAQQFFPLALGMFFYYFGKKLLLQSQNHSKAMISDLFHQKVENVWVIKDGTEVELSIEEVQTHDHIVVNAGDVIPIDGKIMHGEALVDQQVLTGESQPIEKSLGDAVFSSTQLMSGRLVVQVEKTGSDTAVSKIANILQHSADHRVSVLTQGEKLADKVAMPLVTLATVVTPYWGLASASSVLSSSFGNRLQITGSLSVLNHLDLATQKGILIKDGRALEKLSQVDTVLFDKTGTLTEEQPSLGQIIMLDPDYPEEELLAEAAAAEYQLSHPIAKAIVNAAEAQAVDFPIIDTNHFQIGLGVTVTIQDKTVLVGSLRFIEQANIEISAEVYARLEASHLAGHTIVFVAVNQTLKGLLEIHPTVRPEVKQTLMRLKQLGVKSLVIVSGDHEKPTQLLAQALGMDAYFSQVMPEDKGKIVKDLQQQGKTVCFIGDGVNDAIAIQQADVSISIDGATNVAMDLAQIILMDGSLKRLGELFETALSLDVNLKKTINLVYAQTAINLAGIFFFGFGLLTTVLVNNSLLIVAVKQSKKNYLPHKSHDHF